VLGGVGAELIHLLLCRCGEVLIFNLLNGPRHVV
jgi:hypothetical protein